MHTQVDVKAELGQSELMKATRGSGCYRRAEVAQIPLWDRKGQKGRHCQSHPRLFTSHLLSSHAAHNRTMLWETEQNCMSVHCCQTLSKQRVASVLRDGRWTFDTIATILTPEEEMRKRESASTL